MLVSDSLPILWMQYFALSFIVLVTGAFGTRWLPKTLQWTLVGLVAGICWMPWSFHETATATQDSFGGMAPAIIIAVIDVLRHRIGSALLVTLLAGVIGAVLGMLIGARRAARHMPVDHDDGASRSTVSRAGRSERREPTL